MISAVRREIPLGRTNITVAPVGIGTWSWGDQGGWEFGTSHTEEDLAGVVQEVAESGLTILFDTAESYAHGASEAYLGKYLVARGVRAVLATKFSPRRFEVRRKDLFDALRESIRRLSVKTIDLYQIHWPTRFASVESRMDALAAAVEEGLVRAVGVSNFSREQILRAHDALARKNIPLATVQVEYSLLHRSPETDGVASACAERDITLLAYSPMAMGILTGKYTPGHLPPPARAVKYTPGLLSRIRPLLVVMADIASRHQGGTVPQVALNWVSWKGGMPIAGAKSRPQARQNLSAMTWQLTPEEGAILDEASDAVREGPIRG
jgi:aryl-alcohol dehydrogenase-like predicted oxidoreductase